MAKNAKYGILVKTVQGSGYFGQFQFYTFTNENNEKEVFISDNLDDVDTKIEKMINGDYRKKDLLVVDIYDFNAFADLVENANKKQDDPTPTPEPEPEPTPEPTPGEDDPTEDPASDAISVTNVTVDTADGVKFVLVGENLPEDVAEYTFAVKYDETVVSSESGFPYLILTSEDIERYNAATTVKVTVAVNGYTSAEFTVKGE